MSEIGAQDRERAVKAITLRNMLQRRIERSQKRLKALQGEARQSLQDSIAADQAALAELMPALEEVKARMRQEEESVRRRTDEALRAIADLRARQSLHQFPGGSGQWGPGQTSTLLLILAAMGAIVGAVMILNR